MRPLHIPLLFATLTATALPGAAQTVGQNTIPGSPTTYTLSVKSQLVVETVVIKDKQGKPIEGLTANDFTVTEDGVEQKVRYCEYQTLPTTPLPVPPVAPKDEDVKIFSPKANRSTRIAASSRSTST
jgi:hypothetical protein